MKRIVTTLGALMAIFITQSLMAEQWIANCVDGKFMQFTQIKNGEGALNMPVTSPDNSFKIFRVAKLQHSFYNNVAICGKVMGVDNTVTQVCANKEREIIYLKHQKKPGDPLAESGKYCQATISIRP